jgi:hypothetical protein
MTTQWMDGWMLSFTLTPRYASEMQVTITIGILVGLQSSSHSYRY